MSSVSVSEMQYRGRVLSMQGKVERADLLSSFGPKKGNGGGGGTRLGLQTEGGDGCCRSAVQLLLGEEELHGI
jgi:hypothetical protein